MVSPLSSWDGWAMGGDAAARRRCKGEGTRKARKTIPQKAKGGGEGGGRAGAGREAGRKEAISWRMDEPEDRKSGKTSPQSRRENESICGRDPRGRCLASRSSGRARPTKIDLLEKY